jgi:luciferase family oxidoreductase group 1
MSDPTDAPTRPDVPLSILDLAAVGPGESIADSFAGSVALAQSAERLGYERIWYAEHHNIRSIASSATSVLIAHIAAHTETIRLGAGGIMLPNHSPLVIAEQFGTLAELHPGRIDLGLGRAPGSDTAAMRALRRDELSSERFPQDVVELQKWLGDASPVSGVIAIPGKGTNVPLYILGSSLFGAQLAAVLGLPYAFASHFAPAALDEALALYRARFTRSAHLERPYVMLGVNVFAAETDEEGRRLFTSLQQAFVNLRRGHPGKLPPPDPGLVDRLHPGERRLLDEMLSCSVVGSPETVRRGLEAFAARTGADELMVASQIYDHEARLRSYELAASIPAAVTP